MPQNSQFTTIHIGDVGSPVGYIEVLGIATITGLDGTANEIDTTTLKSTAKQRMIGLQDYGSMTFTGNYESADLGQDAMRAAKAALTQKVFKITYPDSKGFTFAGYVQSASLDMGVDAKLATTFKVLVDGDIAEF
jgi:hypothetical protein